MNGDDIRRVTSNWREYAGLVDHGRAKERIAHHFESPSGVLYDTGRAVFSLELLHAVAKVQETRSVTTRPVGSVRQQHIFALSFMLYCTHCDREAEAANEPRLRRRIVGHNKNGVLRYRHSDAHRCQGKARSVLREVIEDEFVRLIDALEVHPEAADLMAELAVQSRFGGAQDEADLEAQKAIAIAKHRRALKNNLTVFQCGDIDGEEYFRQKEYHERQIAYWQAQTTDRQKITLELLTTIEMISRLKRFWDITAGEDRRILAHSLFDEVVYDLDTRRITDFKLKAWAEPFLQMRAALYYDQLGEEMKNRFNSGVSSDGQFHDPTETQSEHETLWAETADALIDYFERTSFPSRELLHQLVFGSD